MKRTLAVFAAAVGVAAAADYPSADISNGIIHAKLYLPDQTNGFYRGTRFDWSGTIYTFKVNGHEYYGPWFDKIDPPVHDFVWRGGEIVAGACSADTGPVNEFHELGYDDAKTGDTFVKIGVGALKRDSGDAYDEYHLYPIADGGKWTVRKHPDGVEFVQELNDSGSGYGYLYEKDIRLVKGKAQMILRQRLKNTGKKKIQTDVYDHNFLVLDHLPPGPGVTISLPFTIQSSNQPSPQLAQIQGHKIVYEKTIAGHEVVQTPVEGFSSSASDNGFRIENKQAGAGMSAQGDHPLEKESLWSIRSVIAMEPFVSISIAPGAEFTWSTTYDYYTLK